MSGHQKEEEEEEAVAEIKSIDVKVHKADDGSISAVIVRVPRSKASWALNGDEARELWRALGKALDRVYVP